MADTLTRWPAALNAEARGVGALLNGGYLRLYGGKPREHASGKCPACIAELRFGTPAFEPAIEGLIVAHKLYPDDDAKGGEATWFAAVAEDGTPVFDGTVGPRVKGRPDPTCVMADPVIRPHALVSIETLIYQAC